MRKLLLKLSSNAVAEARSLLLAGREDKRESTVGRKLEFAPCDVKLPISYLSERKFVNILHGQIN